MISLKNNQVTNQADTSQSQTSQEENLLQEKSELCQEGDTQSAGSEIGESSHLTRMSSAEQIEALMESLGDPEEPKDSVNEPCEEGTFSLTDGNLNSQVYSQASTSQEENLLQGNSDLCQEGDAQSAGSEIGESSHLMRMLSTQPIAVRVESLKDRVREAWEDEREFCLQQKELLSQKIQELQSELERTSACIVPPLCLCSLLCKKNRKAVKENQKLKDKCQKLKGLISETIRLQVNIEKQVLYLDEFENNRKKIQAWESEKRIMLDRIKEKETLLKRKAQLEDLEAAVILECVIEKLARAPKPSYLRRLFCM